MVCQRPVVWPLSRVSATAGGGAVGLGSRVEHVLPTAKRFVQRHITWIPLGFVVAWAEVPLRWSLAASSKTRADVARVQPPFFPAAPTPSSCSQVLIGGFWMFTRNSLIIATVSTLVAVALSTITAYGFAWYAFKWRHILLPRLVPRISPIVPVYALIRAFGTPNTHLALIIAYTCFAIPLATWIMIGYIGAIPKDLHQPAKADGANTWQAFRRFILTLTLPGLLAIGVLVFSDVWNEIRFALAVTNWPEVRTFGTSCSYSGTRSATRSTASSRPSRHRPDPSSFSI